jgi:hypothetical protein
MGAESTVSKPINVVPKKRSRRNRSNSLLSPVAKNASSQGIVSSLIEQLEINSQSSDDLSPTLVGRQAPDIPRSALLDIPTTTRRPRHITGASSMQEYVFPRWVNESSDEENNFPPPRKKSPKSKDSGRSTHDTVIEMDALSTDESDSDTDPYSPGIQLRDDDGVTLVGQLRQIRESTGTKNPVDHTDYPAADPNVDTPLLSNPDYVVVAMGDATDIPERLDSLRNVRKQLGQKPESVFKKMVINPFISMGRYIGNNWAYLLIGGLTAIPGAINAFCNPTGIDPKNLIQAVQLMSFEELMSSLWSMWSNLAPNTVMNSEFFVSLKKDFKKVKDVWQSGIAGKLSIVAAVVTGVSAALAAGSIGYSAFLFLPAGEATALIPAALNAIITFISRFNGLLNLIRQVKEMSTLRQDQGVQIKHRLTDQISHLSNSCQSHLNQFLNDKPINEETAKLLFIEIEKLKAKKALFSTLLNLAEQRHLQPLGAHNFEIDATLKILREQIEAQLLGDSSADLEDLIGLNISIPTLRNIALLNQASLAWRKQYGTNNDAPAWASLADETLALRSSKGIKSFNEDAEHFIQLQNDLINYLNLFANEHQIDLRELVGTTLDTENIDSFIRDINRYPILLNKLMQILKPEIELLHHTALLKAAKTAWMQDQAASSSESLSNEHVSQYAAALAEHLDDFCAANRIVIRNIIPSESITADNLDTILRFIDLLTNPNSSIVDAHTLTEKFSAFGRNVWLTGKIGFAGMAALYIAQVFDFKGFQGLNLLVKQVSELLHKGFGITTVNLNDWSAASKMLAGALPAAATSLFYFKHVFDFLDSIMEKYLFRLVNHPTEIPFAAIMLLHTYFSGSSMRNIASNIAKTPDNFVGMHAGDMYTQFIIEFNFYLAATVNTKILAGLTLARAEQEPSRQHSNSKTTAGVAAYLDELKTLPTSIVQDLVKLSIFAKDKNQPARLSDTNIYDDNRGLGYI